MQTPIKYFGGKNLMFKNIIKHFPSPDTYNSYIEPFGGSYAIGLRLNPIPPIEIYNDLEQNVYSLYKVLSDNSLFNEFKQKCDLIHFSQDLSNEYKNILKQNNNLSILERAFYFFYVNRTTHSGIGGFSINLIIRRNMSKSVSDLLSSIDRLPELHQRLSKLIVLNQDGIKLIQKYNNKENILMYLDPPYHHSQRTSARYKIDMNNEQQTELIETIINSKCKICLSGYKNDLYNKLEENNKFKRIDFNVNTVTGTNKPKTKTESLWINY